jgi:regulator of PEP synthase PpsR (kinase-PPPase family)
MITPTDRLGRRRALSDSYYRRVEAVSIRFKSATTACPQQLEEADVVLLGS